MGKSAAEILAAALNLPESERIVVLEGLLAALPAPGIWDADDPSFVQELERRSADRNAVKAALRDMDQGDVGIPADAHIQGLRKKLNLPSDA